MPTIKYKGNMVSVYRLGQLTGVPLSTLYRYSRKGMVDGEEMVAKAKESRIEFNGEMLTRHQLAAKTGADYRKIRRRIAAGVSVENAVTDKTDRRGNNQNYRFSPTEVLEIYAALFNKEVSQGFLARKYKVNQSTISDIWRGKHWGWLTAPLRYSLENKKG